MSQSESLLPMGDALRVAAIELADLATLGDQLEEIVARLARHAGVATPGLLADCQSADLLSQRLVGVAAFVAALAKASPSGVMVDVLDAVRSITLAEQAHRFSGKGPAAAPEMGEGELALFED